MFLKKWNCNLTLTLHYITLHYSCTDSCVCSDEKPGHIFSLTSVRQYGHRLIWMTETFLLSEWHSLNLVLRTMDYCAPSNCQIFSPSANHKLKISVQGKVTDYVASRVWRTERTLILVRDYLKTEKTCSWRLLIEPASYTDTGMIHTLLRRREETPVTWLLPFTAVSTKVV